MLAPVGAVRSSGGETWEMAVRAPHPGLAGHVGDHCGYRELGGPVQRREVPHAGVVLIVSFGDPIDVACGGGHAATFGSFVAGLTQQHVTTIHAGPQHGIQVDLTPLGAHRLLGVPMQELADSVVELDAVRGREAGELADRLASADGWAARFDLLDSVLLGWLDRGPPVDAPVAWAWRQLDASSGRVPVAALADEIGWSRRHFADRFLRQVGLAPKATARVLRFANAVTLLGTRPGGLADVAAEAGYADHSHMVREFRSLAGCTPSELAAPVPADLPFRSP